MSYNSRYDSYSQTSGYAEYLVSKKTNIKSLLIRAVIILAGIFLAFLMLALTLKTIPAASFIFLVIIAFVTWFILSYTYIEYEYIIVQGEMQIDKISGKKRRKTILEFKLSDAEKIAPKESIERYIKNINLYKTYEFCSSVSDSDIYGIVFSDKNNKKCLIYINVIPKVLDSFKYYRRSVLEIPNINSDKSESEKNNDN